MSNECSNTLTVTGDAKEVAKFTGEVRSDGSPLSWAEMVPSPESEKGRAIYRFVTADSPAVAAVEAAAERWDRLAFELDYFDPNADYRGRLDLSARKIEEAI